ncbi:SAM-dependent methyltransferase [Aquabacterium sp.]|uniref:SAM-dependent methyltransferase n=1 Tax=Aquabacterium sp. TaxID=1872578 RepID=UPI002C41264B|nr:SAM-dependent methyltransferase [Aquabacterium sp.]HSW04860.1 SAM-dependent methyltransferase [Aquabacterium sp.]
MSAPPTQTAQTGRLVLVPNALDLGTELEVELHQVLPQAVIARAASLDHWVAENAKTTRAFLKRVDRLVPLSRPLQDIVIQELPRPRKGAAPAADTQDLRPLLAHSMSGHDIGLLSEAGLPAVADPGALLVHAAHLLGIPVEPLSGPSSLLLALAASGLNGQSFAFVGYLPVEAGARATRIRELDALSRRQGQTQIAIETPYRNAALLAALSEHLQPGTRLSVACGLTLPGGWCRTLTAKAWRDAPPALADRLPAVFSWLA